MPQGVKNIEPDETETDQVEDETDESEEDQSEADGGLGFFRTPKTASAAAAVARRKKRKSSGGDATRAGVDAAHSVTTAGSANRGKGDTTLFSSSKSNVDKVALRPDALPVAAGNEGARQGEDATGAWGNASRVTTKADSRRAKRLIRKQAREKKRLLKRGDDPNQAKIGQGQGARRAASPHTLLRGRKPGAATLRGECDHRRPPHLPLRSV